MWRRAGLKFVGFSSQSNRGARQKEKISLTGKADREHRRVGRGDGLSCLPSLVLLLLFFFFVWQCLCGFLFFPSFYTLDIVPCTRHFRAAAQTDAWFEPHARAVVLSATGGSNSWCPRQGNHVRHPGARETSRLSVNLAITREATIGRHTPPNLCHVHVGNSRLWYHCQDRCYP